jgi:transposase-like protein
VVEVDETYVGGKAKNIHGSKKTPGWNWMDNKFMVFGLKDHNGKVIAFPVGNTHMETLQKAVFDNVERGSTVYSDGHPAYAVLSKFGYGHDWVNHSVGEYVNGLVTTNGIESFWSLLKRGYVGTFHYMSWRHLHRYVNEFSFRHNAGPGNGFRTIGEVLRNMTGRRLTWERLTAEEAT